MSAERLQKLVLMLSATNDGEIVNAAHMITKTLKAMEKDWHWLAGKLATETKTQEPPPRAKPSTDPNTYTDGFMTREEKQMALKCFAHKALLRANELQFIAGLINRASTYLNSTYISAKQRAWLQAIHQRLPS